MLIVLSFRAGDSSPQWRRGLRRQGLESLTWINFLPQLDDVCLEAVKHWPNLEMFVGKWEWKTHSLNFGAYGFPASLSYTMAGSAIKRPHSW